MVVQRFSLTLWLLILAGLQTGMPAQTNRKPHPRNAAASAKLRKMNRAFIASAELKPMAQQLLANRTPQAYAGVEAWAHKHGNDDAGALAWLVLGYAHSLDKDFSKAQSAWQSASGLSPLLGDYMSYLRASAYRDAADYPGVLKMLEGFEQKYPDSLYIHEANLLYADALIVTGSPRVAVVYLEKRREPLHANTELMLARALQIAGDKAKALQVLRRIYFDMPTTAEADTSASEMRSLGALQPEGSYAERRSRAEILLKGKHYQQAVTELGPVTDQASATDLTHLQIEFADALYHVRRRDDAQRLYEGVLKKTDASADDKAQALYYLAEIAREKEDNDRQAEFMSQLRASAPESDWLQQALLSMGNKYMLKHDYESALRWYTEIYQHKQNGKYSPYAHWKTAWLTYRMGKKDEAAKLLEEQLEWYPASLEVPAALYWRGRLAEESSNKRLARACYVKLQENFRYYYYANLGRERMNRLGSEGVVDPPALNKLPSPPRPPQSWDPPEGNLRAQKAQLLANGALYDFAVRELQASTTGSPSWKAELIAQTYQDSGSYVRAIETLKHAIPSYFSTEISQIPQPVWQGLFPRPWWDDLKRRSQENQLDPFLIASLIRQESEFNPGAVSRANALGLMQLLPSVGKHLAHDLKLRNYSQNDLFQPSINLQLGTRYFKHMVDHYNGQLEYALAAYNAGEQRVDDWRRDGDFRDIDEFVESIPFTETREYVQAIIRNAMMYRLLYPQG